MEKITEYAFTITLIFHGIIAILYGNIYNGNEAVLYYISSGFCFGLAFGVIFNRFLFTNKPTN